jgi:DNA-binding transcriptional ArsR family regulator
MRCTICAHEKRAEIDQALINGLSIRDIAEQFDLSQSAVHRHSTNHIKELLATSKAVESLRADHLIEQLSYLQNETLALLDDAKTSGDTRAALQAIREARSNLELKSRLCGELEDRLNIRSENSKIEVVYVNDWRSNYTGG